MKSIIDELKQSPMASISGAVSAIVSCLSLIVAWSQFKVAPETLPTVDITTSLQEGVVIGNVLLIVAFFLSSTFSIGYLLRVLARKHEIAILIISVPVVALVNFMTILIIYLAPPPEYLVKIFLRMPMI